SVCTGTDRQMAHSPYLACGARRRQKMVRELDAGNPHVQFDEGALETCDSATRLCPTLPKPLPSWLNARRNLSASARCSSPNILSVLANCSAFESASAMAQLAASTSRRRSSTRPNVKGRPLSDSYTNSKLTLGI